MAGWAEVGLVVAGGGVAVVGQQIGTWSERRHADRVAIREAVIEFATAHQTLYRLIDSKEREQPEDFNAIVASAIGAPYQRVLITAGPRAVHDAAREVREAIAHLVSARVDDDATEDDKRAALLAYGEAIDDLREVARKKL